jgi:hypothetical protein
MYALDHSHAEVEQEPLELVQAEEATNTELTEGKNRCIPAIIIDFYLIFVFMLSMLVH